MRLIIGLDNFGFQLWNDVIRYCQDTGQPSSPELHKAIYHEAISQVVSILSTDFQDFMLRLMEIPVWTTLHYTDRPIDPNLTRTFADQLRAFGISLWHRMEQRKTMLPNRFHVLESCDTMKLIIASYPTQPG